MVHMHYSRFPHPGDCSGESAPASCDSRSGRQVLDDLAVGALLDHICSFSDAAFDADWVALTPIETEAIARALIQALTHHLSGVLLAAYLDALRHPSSDSPVALHLHLPPPAVDLPTEFPNVDPPKFWCGDRLQWSSERDVTDFGIVIGRFYRFAPHRLTWCWCYLIWLDAQSLSADWITSDLAWEDDLEPI